MSLLLISQSYLMESDSELGEDEDEVEEEEKIEVSHSVVRSYMKSKWDSDEEETGSNDKSYPPSSSNTEPEYRPLSNPSSEISPTSNIPEDVLNLSPPEAVYVSQIEKQQLTSSVSHLTSFEVSLGETTNIFKIPHQSRRPQNGKKEKISRENLKKSSSEAAAKLQVQTLYKCPYCLLTFALADGLIQHLPSHILKNSPYLQRGNAESSKNSGISQVQNREEIRKPTNSRKVPTVKSPKKILKVPKKTVVLRPCEIKLTRCDQLISEWKLLTTKTKILELNINSSTQIRSVTKRRSAAVNAKRKMMRMQEEDELREEQSDSRVPHRPNSQLTNDLGPTGSSKAGHHVDGRTSDPGDSVERSCTKGMPYKCETCFKCFGRKAYLKKHIIQVHTRKKPYVCSTCFKGFSNSEHLKLHIRTHTGERPYKCATCSKRFRQSAHLKGHVLIHTGEKPYKCPTCSKGFRNSAHLKEHVRIHTEEQPYKCPACSKGFRQPEHLKRHIRIHTGEKPYKCSTCSRGFMDSEQLKRHIRTHTGEKPYKCPTCSKRFRNLKYLKEHIRIHTGEKPYKCLTCFKRFRQQAHLKRHIRIHSGEKPN